jgi:hypothetical protein
MKNIKASEGFIKLYPLLIFLFAILMISSASYLGSVQFIEREVIVKKIRVDTIVDTVYKKEIIIKTLKDFETYLKFDEDSVRFFFDAEIKDGMVKTFYNFFDDNDSINGLTIINTPQPIGQLIDQYADWKNSKQ